MIGARASPAGAAAARSTRAGRKRTVDVARRSGRTVLVVRVHRTLTAIMSLCTTYKPFITTKVTPDTPTVRPRAHRTASRMRREMAGARGVTREDAGRAALPPRTHHIQRDDVNRQDPVIGDPVGGREPHVPGRGRGAGRASCSVTAAAGTLAAGPRNSEHAPCEHAAIPAQGEWERQREAHVIEELLRKNACAKDGPIQRRVVRVLERHCASTGSRVALLRVGPMQPGPGLAHDREPGGTPGPVDLCDFAI